MRVALALVLVLARCGHAAKLSEPAFAGVQEERAAVSPSEERVVPLSEVPANRRWMRAFSGECTDCLKECLGQRAQRLQAAALKLSAPLSLITWYLFKNRPFQMWPLENAVEKLGNVHPGVYASGAAVAYLSCQQHCDLECPYPGTRARSEDEPIMPELQNIDPSDHSFLNRLLYRGAGRGGRGGGGGGGGIGDAVSKVFQIV